MKIDLVNFEKIESFYFSKFVYNFCKKIVLELLFVLN